MDPARASVPSAAGPSFDAEWLIGGGEMGECIRLFDWKATRLGARESWPQSLRWAVNLILANQFPMAILWGSDLLFIYNDAYRTIAENKHPGALGHSTRDVWPEVWEFNQPIFEAVMARGETVNLADQLFRIARGGSVEDAYFTLCYSPIRTESNLIGGTLVVLLETTQRLGLERELREAKAHLEIQLESQRQSEERLRLFVEHAPTPLAMFDSAMRYLAVSQRWIGNYSLPDNLIGRLHYDVCPDLPERWRAAHRRGLAGEVVRVEEDRFEHADGRVTWDRYEVRPWHARGGSIGGIIIFTEDITERKQTEAESLRALQRLTEAQRIGRIGDWEWDIAAQEITWSPQTFAILGRDPSLGPPRNYEENAALYEPASAALMAEKVAAAIASGEPQVYELVLLRPDGQHVSAQARAVPRKDSTGRVVGLCGTVQDITERKRVEAALRESEERYRTLFERAPDGIVIIEPRGHYVGVNAATCQMLGYTREEMIGRHASTVVVPAEIPHIQAGIDEVRAGADYHREWQFRRKDGSVFSAEAVAAQMPNGDTIGILRDITERKRAEAALATERDRSQKLARRLLEVQETERRQIASDLHDELGQVLTALKINLQTIQPTAGGTLAPSVALADRALQQTRSLSLTLRPPLLDDLGLELALRWLVDQQAQETGCRITFASGSRSERSAPAIETACFRLTQESITNALRHAKADLITVELLQVGPELRLTVRDNGRGFDLAEARARALRGGSLGLLGMEERATLIGGRVDWETAPGRGTVVHAVFPLSPVTAGAEKAGA